MKNFTCYSYLIQVCIILIMTDSNKSSEGKLYYKTKVGHLIQEYQRSQKVSELQKQQLKHNIMIDILNKRKKQSEKDVRRLESKSQNQQTVGSQKQVLELPEKSSPANKNPNHVQIKSSTASANNSVGRNQSKVSNKQQEIIPKYEEMTFNMKKRNKSLEEDHNIELQPRTTINPIQPEVEQQQNKQEPDFSKSINRIVKYANKYFPEKLKQEEEPQPPKEEVVLEQSNYHKSGNPSMMSHSSMHGSLKYQDGQGYSKKYEYLSKEEELYEPEEQPEDDQMIQQQEEDHRGVFLTMQESESMSASELPKNCAFQIKNDHEADSTYLEQLKRQKIKEIQKKRQERIEEYRRNEASKKVEIPLPRKIKHQKTQKDEVQDFDFPPPKSTTIERKSNMHRPPKMENRSQKQIYKKQMVLQPPNKNKHSYRQIYEQQKKGVGIKQMHSYYEENPYKPVSPIKTPKTIASQQRCKSSHRQSNIFTGDSQYSRQKSATRIPQPKIQPKDRKNSFTRQSNKKLMINAITYVCFPGELNRKERERLVDVLESSQHEFFLFLFKEYSRKNIKGVYVFDSSQTKLQKIFGEKAPYEITADRVKEFYRFDSGSREFKKIDGCRSFSLAIHAIDLR